MSERGVFAVDRGIWDHPLFASRDPFSMREAWMWLVSEACWKGKTVYVGGRRVALGRGQLAHSVRFLADKWGWSKSAVARFLDRLKTETMIGTELGHGISLITICKYDEYQRVSLPDRDEIRDTNRDKVGTAAGQQRDKEEDIKTIETDSVANATDAVASALVPIDPGSAKPVYTDSKHELWGEGVPILVALGVKNREARSNIGRWLRDIGDDAQSVLGAIQRARDNRVIEPIAWVTRALLNGNKNAATRKNVGRINPFEATLNELDFEFGGEIRRDDEAREDTPRMLSHGGRQ